MVEIDESHIGGKRSAVSNRKRKELFGTGRGPTVRMRGRDGELKAAAFPADTTMDKELLAQLLEENVEDGAVVYFDEHCGYAGLTKAGFKRETVDHSVKKFANGTAHVNAVESVWAVLRRSIHGTWHHVSPKHLHRCIRQASFRLTLGKCEVDTIDRKTALTPRVLLDGRLVYEQLTADKGLFAKVEAV